MSEREYAGFWVRLGATLIDVVVVVIVLYVPLTLIYGEAYWLGTKFIHGFWDVLLGYVVPISATIWFWLKYRATPGKMALRLQIVDAQTGNTLSTSQAIRRYFSYFPAMLPLFLGLIWVGIDKRHQGWHDKLAGTVVVRASKQQVQFG